MVALRNLERGEEVVTSYVDLSLPREERQKELQERYKFVCHCEGCAGGSSDLARVDPREAMLCPAAAKSRCEGLIAIPGQYTDFQHIWSMQKFENKTDG